MRWRPVVSVETLPAPNGRARFEQLVLPHLKSAYNVARWLVRDPSLADDVVQDAVLRALNYFDSFKGGDARAWLMRIVRNAAYSALAARQRGDGRHLDKATDTDSDRVSAVPDPAVDPEAALAHSQHLAQLDTRLAALECPP